MIIVNVNYHEKYDLPKLEMHPNGNWCDVRAFGIKGEAHYPAYDDWDSYKYRKGDFFLIHLGFSMQVPACYEAHIVPRSSTYKNYGLVQTNGIGIIDNSYAGKEDYWFMPVLAMRDGILKRGDRVAQFRLAYSMGIITFKEDFDFSVDNRGGHGSTGVA